MDILRQDLRHAARMLGRSPGFTLAAVLTLACGIAANTAIFGFMNALLLRPFPLLDEPRLVSVFERHPQEGAPGGPGESSGDQNPVSVADYLDLVGETPGLDAVSAYRYHPFVVTEAGEPARVSGFQVTPGYFETIGVRPVVGRPFRAEEATPGKDGVVLLSHAFWDHRFGRDAGILGRAIVLDGARREIVGVLPAALNFPPGRPEVFVPLAFSEAEKADRRLLRLQVVGRVAAASELGSARATLDAFAGRLAARYPATNAGRSFVVAPLREMQTGFTAPFVLLFEGAAAFVLLIACANVAGLLLARGAGREREMAMRAALGAGRLRIVRQLLTEAFLLALLGATAAVWLASVGVDLLRAGLPPDLVRWIAGWSEIGLDRRALVFTLGLTVATTFAFGLLPAARAARASLGEVVKRGRRGGSGAPRRGLRSGLVAVQVALALVLLSGAALMTRGFADLVHLYQGFDPERVVTLGLDLPEWRYPDGRPVADFYARVVHGVEATAGVESAGVASQLPADLGPIPRASFVVEGRPLVRAEEKPTADLQTITPGYLRALRVSLLRGRSFSDADGPETPRVVLVSESLAARYWPGEDPVGRRVRVSDEDAWASVIGVVADVRQYWWNPEPRPTLYVAAAQSPRRTTFLVVRSALPSSEVMDAARARVREIDPLQPVEEVRTMAAVVSDSASFIRMAAALMATLGVVALVLASVGLYGVVAEHVAHRTQEIGVRMALGAGSADVLRLVVGQTARLAAAGLVAGLFAAWATGRAMAGALFGIVRIDAATIGVVAIVLAVVACAAAWIPARRATRVDPLLALREE
jgi:putative ABC transport system permease protein